jgi:leucyl-tRNA synthetase
MVIAPEHPLVNTICTSEQRTEIEAYLTRTKSKSDIDRQSEKEVSGCFTGAYAVHPFLGNKLPIYVADYVLMGYGTGAIMAVPAEDDRDQRFAQKFDLKITEIYDKTGIEVASPGDKKGILINSDSYNGLDYQNAQETILNELTRRGIGTKKIQYRLRDANFSRQRYWGEPIPILWKDDIPYPLNIDQLPLVNPEVDSFLPSAEGKSPLSRNASWVNEIEGYQRETDTMPGYAGSSWYFLRYMNPKCDQAFVDNESANYWNQVDLYIGGTEHAVGHLMYSRFWNMFLYDRGYISFEEPFKKMINQGMIQGRTNFVYRSNQDLSVFVSKNLVETYPGGCSAIRVDVNIVENDELNIHAFKAWRKEYEQATFVLENGKYLCGWEVEKMSKSKYNVVNPDDVIEKYGADTFRMYEMFLGPVEMSKPWNTAGIEGVSKFLRRFWNLYFDEQGSKRLKEGDGSAEELKTLHKTIIKISDDIEKFSFNTSVSAFMIAVNEFQSLKTDKESILLPFAKLLAPFAPHTVEAIWTAYYGHELAIHSEFPIANPQYLVESTIEYPVSINGKMRTKITLDIDASAVEAESSALQDEIVLKWIDGQPIKKFIFVPKRMINIVL